MSVANEKTHGGNRRNMELLSLCLAAVPVVLLYALYIVNDNGRYETIVPPAGALVDSLPEDFDTITLGNAEYYRVDDTVYRVTLVGGKPYLEVLGQMYGKMAREYSLY